MPTLQQALYYELVNDGGVSALVGNRVYPAGMAAQSPTEPYITYQRTVQEHVRHFTNGSDLRAAEIQIDVWAATEVSAEGVFEAVESLLNDYSGDMGEAGSTIDVRGSFLDTDSMSFEEPTDAGERGAHRVTMNFTIWYRP